MVNTIWFQFDLIRFRKYFSVCTVVRGICVSRHHMGVKLKPLTPLSETPRILRHHDTEGFKGPINGSPLCQEPPVSQTAEIICLQVNQCTQRIRILSLFKLSGKLLCTFSFWFWVNWNSSWFRKTNGKFQHTRIPFSLARNRILFVCVYKAGHFFTHKKKSCKKWWFIGVVIGKLTHS